MVEYQRNGSRNPLRPIRPCELLGVLSAIRKFAGSGGAASGVPVTQQLSVLIPQLVRAGMYQKTP